MLAKLLAATLVIVTLGFARAIHARHRRIDILQGRLRRLEHSAERQRHLLGPLRHDLRSPLATILGYQELLADGLLGSLDPPALDAVDRIGNAARNQLLLVDAFAMAAHLDSTEPIPPGEPAELDGLLDAVLHDAHGLATDRRTLVEIRREPQLPTLHTVPEILVLGLQCAFAAAVRATPGDRLVAHVRRNRDSVLLSIEGLTAAPAPDPETPTPGLAGLHFLLADRLLRPLGAAPTLRSAPDGSIVLHISIPAPPD